MFVKETVANNQLQIRSYLLIGISSISMFSKILKVTVTLRSFFVISLKMLCPICLSRWNYNVSCSASHGVYMMYRIYHIPVSMKKWLGCTEIAVQQE